MASCPRGTRSRSPASAISARKRRRPARPPAPRRQPMFEALIVTLREGVEAALVVGIIIAFLRKEGYERYLGAVWAGIGVATVASLVGAWALYNWAVNEEAFE